jgi:hypothetical protein
VSNEKIFFIFKITLFSFTYLEKYTFPQPYNKVEDNKEDKNMKLKNVITVLAFVSLFHHNVYSQNMDSMLSVILAEYKGKVEVLRNNTNIQVKKGMSLQENDVIKTKQNSFAVLLFQDGSKITLAENTEVVINDLKFVQTSVSLQNGKLRTKVSPRQTSQVFEVKTPVSVASVRGTEFILSFVDNKSELVVIEGKVLFSDLLGNNIEVTEFESCYISDQGIGEKTKVDQNKVDSLINEFRTKTEQGQTEQEKSELIKSELKTFVSEIKLENYYFTNTILQVKEADFQTGRTLVDVHGNLTRVEQSVSRNKDNSIEFINITKRDSYKYNGYFKDYKTQVESNEPRVDIFRLGVEFSDTLPEKISEWPSYIMNKGEDFYPTKVYYELSNLKDKFYGETNFTKIVEEKPIYEWRWDPYTGTEQQVQVGTEKETRLEGKTQNYIINADGKKYTVDTDYDENIKGKLPEGKSKEDDDGKLCFWAEGPIPVKEDITGDGNVDNKDFLWLQTEGYSINNNGDILTPSYFTGSSKDPFTILKEVAVESIIFVRKDNNGTPGESFFKRNIDLVVTPDIVIAMVKQIAPSLNNLKLE